MAFLSVGSRCLTASRRIFPCLSSISFPLLLSASQMPKCYRDICKNGDAYRELPEAPMILLKENPGSHVLSQGQGSEVRCVSYLPIILLSMPFALLLPRYQCSRGYGDGSDFSWTRFYQSLGTHAVSARPSSRINSGRASVSVGLFKPTSGTASKHIFTIILHLDARDGTEKPCPPVTTTSHKFMQAH